MTSKEAQWEALDSISKSRRWIGVKGNKWNAYKLMCLQSEGRVTNIVAEAVYVSPRGKVIPTQVIADDIEISNEAARVLFSEDDVVLIEIDN